MCNRCVLLGERVISVGGYNNYCMHALFRFYVIHYTMMLKAAKVERRWRLSESLHHHTVCFTLTLILQTCVCSIQKSTIFNTCNLAAVWSPTSTSSH